MDVELGLRPLWREIKAPRKLTLDGFRASAMPKLDLRQSLDKFMILGEQFWRTQASAPATGRDLYLIG